MEERIKKLLEEVQSFNAKTKDALEAYRLKYISRKGAITELFEELKKVSVDEKKRLGKVLNELKQSAEAKFSSLQEDIESNAPSSTDH
jgi:phenylalanyl-tRNA synthetase alpha chain